MSDNDSKQRLVDSAVQRRSGGTSTPSTPRWVYVALAIALLAFGLSFVSVYVLRNTSSELAARPAVQPAITLPAPGEQSFVLQVGTGRFDVDENGDAAMFVPLTATLNVRLSGQETFRAVFYSPGQTAREWRQSSIELAGLTGEWKFPQIIETQQWVLFYEMYDRKGTVLLQSNPVTVTVPAQ